MANRPRVIISLSDITECGQVADWLFMDGYEPVRRATPRAALDEIELPKGFDVLIAEAAFAFRDGLHAASRKRNPMTPTVVVGHAAAEKLCEAVGGQAMFLARPIERVMLGCTVTMALLDGRPLRCSPRKLVTPFAAVVDGLPSQIIDVSNEGLRLQVPRDRRWVPPPYFNVRVPIIGAAVTVQRMWTRAWPGNGKFDATWCGVALSQNRPGIERAWRGLVDTIPGAGRSAPHSIQVE